MAKRVVLEISEDLHKQFKAFCADNGTTITQEVTSFICGLLESKAEMEKEAQTEDKKQIPLKQEKSFDIVAFREGLGLKPPWIEDDLEKEDREEIIGEGDGYLLKKKRRIF